MNKKRSKVPYMERIMRLWKNRVHKSGTKTF